MPSARADVPEPRLQWRVGGRSLHLLDVALALLAAVWVIAVGVACVRGEPIASDDAFIASSTRGTWAAAWAWSSTRASDVSVIVTRGYARHERMSHRHFVRRFQPAFAVMYGNRPDVALTETLRYRRVAYFPAQGFEDFTVFRREAAP